MRLLRTLKYAPQRCYRCLKVSYHLDTITFRCVNPKESCKLPFQYYFRSKKQSFVKLFRKDFHEGFSHYLLYCPQCSLFLPLLFLVLSAHLGTSLSFHRGLHIVLLVRSFSHFFCIMHSKCFLLSAYLALLNVLPKRLSKM